MLKIRLGDITKIETQAMVNSANPSLLAGGGVCGAIHRVAGPQLEVACRAIGKIVAGEAVLTRAFDLPAEFVIHAVAPRFFDGERHEAATLKQTYISICKVLAVTQITSVTLPSLGTGIYTVSRSTWPLPSLAKRSTIICLQTVKPRLLGSIRKR